MLHRYIESPLPQPITANMEPIQFEDSGIAEPFTKVVESGGCSEDLPPHPKRGQWSVKSLLWGGAGGGLK